MLIYWYFIFALSSQSVFGAPKVISLSPAITEIIFKLGLGDAIVGTVEHSDFPTKAKEIPRVGEYNKPNIEKILNSKPDIVFIPKEGPDQITYKLKDLGINYQVFEIKNLEQIALTAKEISKTLNKKEAGEKFYSNWNKKLKALKNAKNRSQKTLSLIVVQSEPLIVAASNTFLDEMLTLCGGKNIFSHLKGYPRVQKEAYLNKNFESVLLVEHFASVKQKEQSIKSWQMLSKKVSVINPDIATRPGPRLLLGVEFMCAAMKEYQLK
ncbi:MAG: ABC transporter substrate-binding protein [Oligoflexia bacterium]|nr:ABC transporter substrate-binding protein [Oligoflexia bacterium]